VYKRYIKYKETGLYWLGSIPAHWEIRKPKQLGIGLDPIVQTGPFGAQLHASDYVDEGVPLILIGNVGIREFITDRIPKISSGDAARLSTYLVRKGDIVFSRVGSIGRMAVVTEEQSGWMISGQMLRLRMSHRKIDPRYASYVLGDSSVKSFFQLNQVGSTRDSINTSILSNVPFPYPPLNEQNKINEFLDNKVSNINALIEKKRRLIELLQEKRTALITRAVTKGLDPDAPMKDSGVEWLGEIPAHWEVLKLKYLSNESLKYGANEAAEFTNEDWPRFIRITDIRDDGTLREDTKKTLSLEVAQEYFLLSGDILFARSGATVGKTFLFDGDNESACYAGYLIRFRPIENRIIPKYLALFTRSICYARWRDGILIQATIQNISAEKYGNLQIPIPTLNEQRSILAMLEGQLNNLDLIVGLCEQAISRFEEYRSSLISHAVTGKIDVRGEGS